MTAYMKYTTAKLVYILDNLDQFTKAEVIFETNNAVDHLVHNGEELRPEMLGGFQTLAMAIQKIKCADC